MEGLQQLITVVGVLGAGFVQKNFLSKVPNDIIPIINMVLGMVATYIADRTVAAPASPEEAVTVGASLGAGAIVGLLPTAIHQIGKIFARKMEK